MLWRRTSSRQARSKRTAREPVNDEMLSFGGKPDRYRENGKLAHEPPSLQSALFQQQFLFHCRASDTQAHFASCSKISGTNVPEPPVRNRGMSLGLAILTGDIPCLHCGRESNREHKAPAAKQVHSGFGNPQARLKSHWLRLISNYSSPGAFRSPYARPQAFELHDLAVVHEEVHVRAVVLDIPAENFGVGGFEHKMFKPERPMILATTSVRHVLTFSVMPSDSIMIM